MLNVGNLGHYVIIIDIWPLLINMISTTCEDLCLLQFSLTYTRIFQQLFCMRVRHTDL